MTYNAHVVEYLCSKIEYAFKTQDEPGYQHWSSLLLKEDLSMDALKECVEREKEYIPF